VNLLRQAGAAEVHMRISAPPYRYPCYYGIDTSVSGELIAASKTVEEIRRAIGADSLAYLSLEALHETVTGLPDWPVAQRCCMACFDGQYPVPVDEAHGKYDIERPGRAAPRPAPGAAGRAGVTEAGGEGGR